MNDAVIGSLHHIARVIDQLDHNMPLSFEDSTMYVMNVCVNRYAFLRFGDLVKVDSG